MQSTLPTSPAKKPRRFLPYHAAGIPASLREHPHWLVCDRTGQPVRMPEVGNSKTNPSHWADFDTVSRLAEAEHEHWPYIVLTDETPFTVFDVDFKPRRTTENALETEDEYAARKARAQAALQRLRELFPTRYESRSKSGRGFHIIVRGKFLGGGGVGKGDWQDVEIYTRDHGVALTGHVVEGHDAPAEYPDEMIQAIRDEMKGRAATSGDEYPADPNQGTVRPEHAREVLHKIAQTYPHPDYPNWRDISSAAFGGLGVEQGIELLQEVWPEKDPGEYRKLAVSLKWYAAWDTLRSFGVHTDDPQEWLDFLPDAEDGGEAVSTPKPRKRLADCIVDHSTTLGMTWQEIDALRPPIVIEGFLRQGEVLLLGAESKSRKSWLAQDAGFAVASGVQWLADEAGDNGFETAQARVHVCDLELNPAEMRYRCAKARSKRFRNAPVKAASMTKNLAAYSFDGMGAKDILRLIEELKATVNAGDLVIVDCLYRIAPDGNEAKEIADIFEIVKRFAADTQAGVILVDHFRKAGDDKARNRFAGSFIKQASASTLVAIEVKPGDILAMNIDARTFHGCERVHARFNPETYVFNRIPEEEAAKAKEESKRAEMDGWIERLWRDRRPDAYCTASDAVERWSIKRQGAMPRLRRLVSSGMLTEKPAGTGKPITWTLTPAGVAALQGHSDEL